MTNLEQTHMDLVQKPILTELLTQELSSSAFTLIRYLDLLATHGFWSKTSVLLMVISLGLFSGTMFWAGTLLTVRKMAWRHSHMTNTL